MNNQRKTTEQFKKDVFNLVGNEYEVLGEYTTNKTLIKMKHNKCGYIFEMRPLNFLNLNNRCPNCSKRVKRTTDSFKKDVFNLVGNEYEVLGEYVTNKTHIKMKHNKCGYIWDAYPKWFLNGTRCPNCSHGSKRKTTEQFKEEVFNLVGNEYEVLGEYTTNRNHIKMKHNKCNKEYLVAPSVFLNNRRCPYCSLQNSKSKNVLLIEDYLNKMNIKYFEEYSFKDFISNKNNIPYRFDFYLPDYNLLIEYDGEQHFKPWNNKEDDPKFKNLKESDAIKTKYAKDHNIELLRINYKENALEKLENRIKFND